MIGMVVTYFEEIVCCDLIFEEKGSKKNEFNGFFFILPHFLFHGCRFGPKLRLFLDDA